VYHRELLSMLNATAEATLAPGGGRADVRAVPVRAELEAGARENTRTAAGLLNISERQVRRIASELGGRRINRSWCFDRAAVLAAAVRRQEIHD
jgi:hypothetical protein